MASGVSAEQQFIMDSLAQFFTGDANASYKSAFEEYFATAELYGAIVRRVRPEKLEKDVVRGIAQRVNQDAEGQIGDVQNFITDQDNTLTNIDFFVHFKILYKVTQMALTTQRRDAYQAKMKGNTGELNSIEAQIATQQSIADNLNFGELLAEEANRIRTVEIAELTEKHNKLQEEMAKLDGQDFNAQYFAEQE